MSPKAQHSLAYRRLPAFIRCLREEGGLTQRQLGARMGKPQSWVHNCEVGNRRMDVTEFIAWAKGCGFSPLEAFRRLVEEG